MTMIECFNAEQKSALRQQQLRSIRDGVLFSVATGSAAMSIGMTASLLAVLAVTAIGKPQWGVFAGVFAATLALKSVGLRLPIQIIIDKFTHAASIDRRMKRAAEYRFIAEGPQTPVHKPRA